MLLAHRRRNHWGKIYELGVCLRLWPTSGKDEEESVRVYVCVCVRETEREKVVDVPSGHPYAYYAPLVFLWRLVRSPSISPLTPRVGDASVPAPARELKRLINIWNKGNRFSRVYAWKIYDWLYDGSCGTMDIRARRKVYSFEKDARRNTAGGSGGIRNDYRVIVTPST